jgi:DNA-binding CsgD family transcriptional regulator
MAARQFFRQLLEHWRHTRKPGSNADNQRTSRSSAMPWEAARLSGVDPALLADPLYKTWLSLSAREQQVAALTCLYYTNGEMALTLCLSIETVREYVRNAVRKFGVRSKDELRELLGHWDFTEWAEPHRPRWIRKQTGEKAPIRSQ